MTTWRFSHVQGQHVDVLLSPLVVFDRLPPLLRKLVANRPKLGLNCVWVGTGEDKKVGVLQRFGVLQNRWCRIRCEEVCPDWFRLNAFVLCLRTSPQEFVFIPWVRATHNSRTTLGHTEVKATILGPLFFPDTVPLCVFLILEIYDVIPHEIHIDGVGIMDSASARLCPVTSLRTVVAEALQSRRWLSVGP